MRDPTFSIAVLAGAHLLGCQPSRPAETARVHVAAAPPSDGVTPAAAPLRPPPCVAPPPIAPGPLPPVPDAATLAQGIDSHHGALITSSRTTITARPSPFLTAGTLLYVEHMGHHHPITFHVGAAEGRRAVVLSSSAVFRAFAEEVGLVLQPEASRVAYVKTYLGLDPGYQELLESANDFRFHVPRTVSPDDPVLEIMGPAYLEVAQRRREVEDRFGPSITPLCLAGAAPWHGTIHAIKRPVTLVRIEVTLHSDGKVATRQTVLATEVPVTQWGH
jgi:hypothetical protein